MSSPPRDICHRHDCTNEIPMHREGQGKPQRYCSDACRNRVDIRRKRSRHRKKTDSADLRAKVMMEHGIEIPMLPTLRKYGLTVKEYIRILERQYWKCPVCDRNLDSLKVSTDHEHVPGWSKMSKSERKKHVRGICCSYCNWYVLGRNNDPDILKRAASYLYAHRRRQRRRKSS